MHVLGLTIEWEKDKIMKQMDFVESKGAYSACLKNIVNFFVAWIYKMNV